MRVSLTATIATMLCLLSTLIDAQPRTFSVAFYNIRSGKGMQPLRGAASPFAESDSCTGSNRPLNAWGAGVVQKELVRMVQEHPDVIALGLAEAWACASPDNVRQVLGWKEHAGERNGSTIVARYGFGRRPEWVQLDTSHNSNPRDTMWVVGTAVCMAAGCADSADLYVTHWSGNGPQGRETYDKQARDTVAFMQRSTGPHVLLGDLNVFEGSSIVCRQQPNNTTLEFLRAAGYRDVWPVLHPNDNGYTGMLNRPGCGTPEGSPWKRIDYAWSKNIEPAAISQFGTVPPGAPAPSDHVGIVASFRTR